MRILIIGDYPGFSGGVTNYTRPLAEYLAKVNEVYYLYSCTRTENYDIFSMRVESVPQLDKSSSVSFFELINPPTRYLNYDKLNLDHDDWIDDIISDFLKKIKPEVIHINEIFGFSSRLIRIAKDLSIKVIVTVHEYWWLCPHRVMVDFNRMICDGPNDLKKCSHCTQKKVDTYKRNSRLRIYIKRKMTFLYKFYMNVYKKSQISALNEDLNFGSEQIPDKVNTKLQTQLEKRLSGNIEYLNMCDLIIGVSSDVKNILTTYGVNSDLILVNHIGSEIAQRKILHSKKVDQNNIVFGFIGGVGYYKGVHQLVEAYMLLSTTLKSKSSIYIYGKYDIGYYNSLMQLIETDEIAKDRILFKGKFSPADLPAITNTIDISVLPSLCADTAPQTIFESFSAGLPIIAPSVGGFPDFVINNVNGLLYEKASISDLNKQLEKVILESELIEKFSLNIPPLKTMSEHVSQIEKIYKTS